MMNCISGSPHFNQLVKYTRHLVSSGILEEETGTANIYKDSNLLATVFCFAVLVKTGLSAVWADQHDPHIECIRAKEYLLVISLSQIPSPDCLSGPFFGLD